MGDHHVGGHRFAANLVLLPHGLYYGPVAGASAEAAITAYERARSHPTGTGAGRPAAQAQAADHARMRAGASRSVSGLA